MYEILHRIDEPWTDLTGLVLDHTTTRAVAWISATGTWQILARADGDLTRVRIAGAGRGEHPGDGLPLLVEDFWGTACGCGDASGYRSTLPLLVAVIESRDDISAVGEQAKALRTELVAAEYDFQAVPEGHPPTPCPALYCRLTAATADT